MQKFRRFISLCGALVAAACALDAVPARADTFSTNIAAPGATVTLTGQARPNSLMSAYFYCDAQCGETHVGAATTNLRGQYALSFNIPANAKPGGAQVAIGCDRCGNGWRTVRGLNIQGQQASGRTPPPAANPTVHTSSDTFTQGSAVTIYGTATPGSQVDAALSPGSNLKVVSRLGSASVGANGQYSISAKVPVNFPLNTASLIVSSPRPSFLLTAPVTVAAADVPAVDQQPGNPKTPARGCASGVDCSNLIGTWHESILTLDILPDGRCKLYNGASHITLSGTWSSADGTAILFTGDVQMTTGYFTRPYLTTQNHSFKR
jgi:hypothetical protein